MFKNYLKSSWRNILRHKFFSSINILGLAIGLASFITILIYLNYELSYNKWDPSLARVYKITLRTDEEILGGTPSPLSKLLQNNLPEIEAATNIQASGTYETLVGTGNKKLYQSGAVSADSSFLKVFPYKLLSGDPKTALDAPDAIILSKEFSEKLFGQEDAMGKVIRIYNSFDCRVTGIYEQPDKPSDLVAQFVFRNPYDNQNKSWENLSYTTYVKTTGAVKPDKLQSDIDGVYYHERLKRDNQTLADFRRAGHLAGLYADSFYDLHNFPKHGNSNFKTVFLMLVLSTLLLVSGAINFSNLSIAISASRTKEIGVRKVLGSLKHQLVWQFLSEMSLQCLASLLIAAILVKFFLIYLSRQFNVHLIFWGSDQALTISLQVLLCLVVVILLSGLYPAIFLSGLKTINILKGIYTRGEKGKTFRNALIVIQFVVSAFFVIAIITISRQMKFMQQMDKGYSDNLIMRIEANQQTRDANFSVVRNELLNIPGVRYVTKSTTVPGDGINNQFDTATFQFQNNGRIFNMLSVKVSTDYFKALKIPTVIGRDFDSSYADQHTQNVIINQSALQLMNLKNPLGSSITYSGCDSLPMQLVGVVSNSIINGFETSVQPTIYSIGINSCGFQSGGAILVKLESEHAQQSVDAIENAWKKIDAESPIRYSFLDRNYQKLFTTYSHQQKIISFFGIISIVISAMGLFALSAYLMNQRNKEISIRKVLGANAGNISVMLGKDFIIIVLLATLISIPFGWWASHQWLYNFAYHISLGWQEFSLAFLIVVALSVIIVAYHAFRSAALNPVKGLRNE
ncbi:MAG: ABC transporter permease [Bacteroidetes bacterium]|nr:ABC transporter permease [Bacteroidota bacterium]